MFLHFWTSTDDLRQSIATVLQKSLDLLLLVCDPLANIGLPMMENMESAYRCSLNIISTATELCKTGIIPMMKPQSTVAVDSSAGLVRVVADCKGGKCAVVAVDNAFLLMRSRPRD